ncbi:hypothetical protein HDU92_004295 [Lobulomyces angularis]|nr:hypothetical protein HDU92_004295 [Lobulomyces angularis]
MESEVKLSTWKQGNLTLLNEETLCSATTVNIVKSKINEFCPTNHSSEKQSIALIQPTSPILRRHSIQNEVIKQLSSSITQDFQTMPKNLEGKISESENEDAAQSDFDEDEELEEILQQKKFLILMQWIKEEKININLTHKKNDISDSQTENLYLEALYYLTISFLRKRYPNIEQVTMIFWNFCCKQKYLKVLLKALTENSFKETIVDKFGREEWENLILCVVEMSQKVSESSTSISEPDNGNNFNGYQTSTLYDENYYQKKNKFFSKDFERLRDTLFEIVPEDDYWEEGCLAAARTGRLEILKLFFDKDKVKFAVGYLLREAADHGQWFVVSYIMKKIGFSEKQRGMVKMYKSLYMIQQGALDGRWDVVDNVITSWRSEGSESFNSKGSESFNSKGSESFNSKWRVAVEMSCEKGRTDILKRLFQLRMEEEIEYLIVTLRMLSLALKSENKETIEVLLSLLPESSANEYKKSDTSKSLVTKCSALDLLSNLPSSKSLKYQELLCRFCLVSDTSISRNLNFNLEVEEANDLKANLLKFLLASGEVDVENSEIENCLRNIFIEGNIKVGIVLINFGIQFDWMENSIKNSYSRYNSNEYGEDLLDRENSNNFNFSKSDEKKPAGENFEYMSMVSMYGVTDNSMISFNDFETILAKAILVDKDEDSYIPPFATPPLLGKTSSIKRKTKTSVKEASPRWLIDNKDKVWSEFLSGTIWDESSYSDIKIEASWMEPNNSFNIKSNDISQDDIEQKYSSKNHFKPLTEEKRNEIKKKLLEKQREARENGKIITSKEVDQPKTNPFSSSTTPAPVDTAEELNAPQSDIDSAVAPKSDTTISENRKELIENAIKFLKSPKVKAADNHSKKMFLLKKGLTEIEIDECLKKTVEDKSESKILDSFSLEEEKLPQTNSNTIHPIVPTRPEDGGESSSKNKKIFDENTEEKVESFPKLLTTDLNNIEKRIMGLNKAMHSYKKVNKFDKEIKLLKNEVENLSSTCTNEAYFSPSYSTLSTPSYSYESESSKKWLREVNSVKTELRSIKGSLLSSRNFPGPRVKKDDILKAITLQNN